MAAEPPDRGSVRVWPARPGHWNHDKRTCKFMEQGLSSLIFLALLIGIFYFMLIRPQKRRVQEHRSLVESIGVGDEVVTIGGIFGRIVSVGDDEVELEIAGGTTVRFVKSAIARRVTEDLEEEDVVEIPEEEEA
jgi:preprotein translocase subunit YajC